MRILLLEMMDRKQQQLNIYSCLRSKLWTSRRLLKKHEPMVWAIVQVYGKDLENRFKDHSELKASPASTKGKMDTIKLDRQRSIWALLSSLSIYGTDHRRARCWESRPGFSRIPIMAFLVLKQPSLPFPTSPSRCHHLPLAKRQIDPA
jgi:hypothetical protein